jgi:hypothetical protein
MFCTPGEVPAVVRKDIARWLFAASVEIIRGQESRDLSRAKDDERQEV